jgi:hypothetical protein
MAKGDSSPHFVEQKPVKYFPKEEPERAGNPGKKGDDEFILAELPDALFPDKKIDIFFVGRFFLIQQSFLDTSLFLDLGIFHVRGYITPKAREAQPNTDSWRKRSFFIRLVLYSAKKENRPLFVDSGYHLMSL